MSFLTIQNLTVWHGQLKKKNIVRVRGGFPGGSVGKESSAGQEAPV